MILAAVIWRRENRNHGGKGLLTAPAVHLVAVGLDLVGANYAQIVVLGEQLFDGFEAEFDGTFALIVACVGFFSCFFVIEGVGPEQVAEKTFQWWFDKSIQLIDVFSGV